ncbi:MAG: MFS transporter [Chitinophagaceae bacterium]
MNQTISSKTIRSVIAASSVGTMIEWYDFYIFGSLANVISTKFFPDTNPVVALLSTLATFAAGFVVRPFGALFFGRLGDLIGRKYTFLVTLILMGLSTFLIGCIPSYKTIGFVAPLLVLLLRLLQGLALGGEYGGAATYVAEHAPTNKRGFWTSWIQTTATIGLFISLLVIILTKGAMSEKSFDEWGWRVPFWISIIMVAISVVIRMRMHESPLFAKIKAEGKTSVNPLKESFGHKLNFKFVLLALFGATMGQGVVWYTGQFYALSFIQTTLSVDVSQASKLIMWAILFATPFFVVFGGLSDRIGRKWIMLGGMLLAIICYRPIYTAMFESGSVSHKTEITDQTKTNFMAVADGTAGDSIKTTTILKTYTDGTTFKQTRTEKVHVDITKADPKKDIKTTKSVKLDNHSFWMLVLLVFIQVLFVTMVYGPIAAFLVEMFPVKIRYTSMSLPYHIGNGIFGGLLPAIALFLTTKASEANVAAAKAGQAVVPYDKPYLEGLWYPIIIAAVCFVIGALYINGKDNRIDD